MPAALCERARELACARGQRRYADETPQRVPGGVLHSNIVGGRRAGFAIGDATSQLGQISLVHELVHRSSKHLGRRQPEHLRDAWVGEHRSVLGVDEPNPLVCRLDDETLTRLTLRERELGLLPCGDVLCANRQPARRRMNTHLRPEVSDRTTGRLAFVDIGMPGFNGYELARPGRAKLGSQVRLVAITGFGRAADSGRH
jgi:hypothetical protein